MITDYDYLMPHTHTHTHTSTHNHHTHVCVCVCVCVNRERERERESGHVVIKVKSYKYTTGQHFFPSDVIVSQLLFTHYCNNKFVSAKQKSAKAWNSVFLQLCDKIIILYSVPYHAYRRKIGCKHKAWYRLLCRMINNNNNNNNNIWP